MPKSKQRKNKKQFISRKTIKEKQDAKLAAEAEAEAEVGVEGGEVVLEEQSTADILLENDFDIEEFQGKAEGFINNNKGLFLGVLGALFLGAALYFFYSNVYVGGQEEDAQAELYQAQQYFEIDSFRLALNGDGNFSGFLDIADNFSGSTKAANLANYYAGVSFLNLGEFENAIQYLEKFSSSDQLVSVMAKGAMGDAYMELGQEDKGINLYKQAGTMNANELTSPMFLLKAGLAMERKGDFAGAKEMFEKIKEYPSSTQAAEAEKYIAKVQAQM